CSSPGAPRDLRSFPTRRSSDLRDGLALANTIQNSTHAVILYLLLRQALPDFSGRGLGGYALRVGLAALGMGGALLVLLPLLQTRSEEHTSELQSLAYLVCRLLL